MAISLAGVSSDLNNCTVHVLRFPRTSVFAAAVSGLSTMNLVSLSVGYSVTNTTILENSHLCEPLFQ